MSARPKRASVAVIQGACAEGPRCGFNTNRKTALRVWDLMESTHRHPMDTLDKPAHLKHLGDKVWSRRDHEAERLVDEVLANRIAFLHARCHHG